MLSPVTLRSCYRATARKTRPKLSCATLRTSPTSVRKSVRCRSSWTTDQDPVGQNPDPFSAEEKTEFSTPNSAEYVSSTKPSLRPNAFKVISKAWGKKQIPQDKLSHHWETLPPTDAQLEYADKFFTRRKPDFLWSAPKFHSMSFGDSPEVCVLGRSNAGKSSLLNALFERMDIAHASSKPGRTRTMNAFAVGDEHDFKKRLVVLDMPGYGKGGQAAWGTEILKYLKQRKELTRAFLLVDSEHRLKTSDKQLLALFRQQNIPHQVLFAKVDKLLCPSMVYPPSDGAMARRLTDLNNRMKVLQKTIQPDKEDESGALGEIISFSSKFKINGMNIGIDLVRHAMLQAAGLELQTPRRKRVRPVEIVPFDQIPGMIV